MRAVDEVVLPLLHAVLPPITNTVTGVANEPRVHDGQVQVNTDTQTVGGRQVRVVSYALPYIVYTSSQGDDDNPRLSGRKLRNSVFIGLKFVGIDRNQVKWAQERVRGQLERRRLIIPGHKSWPAKLDSCTRVWRDDDAMRPDGSALFYADEAWSLSVMLNQFPALVEATP